MANRAGFSKSLLRNIGVDALEYILQNVRNGSDSHGHPYAYSTKPFYRPFDAKLWVKMGKRNKGKLYNIIKGSNGKLGFIIMGYAAFKEKMKPDSMDKFLSFSGTMLRNMSITDVDGYSVTLGFPDPVQNQKAYWFNVAGVGRSKKLWQFFGLTPDKVKLLANKYETEITNELIKGIKLSR